MANTTPDGIYYPDSNTLMNFDAILSTMASSIQNGIGKRLALQEIAVGLKGSIASNRWNVPVVTPTLVPYTIASVNGDFNQGMDFTEGLAKVQTPGMYLVTATLGIIGGVTGRGIKIQVEKNAVRIATLETPQYNGIWGASSVTAVLNCVAGDTIRAAGSITGSGAVATAVNGESTHISIAMVQAIPQA